MLIYEGMKPIFLGQSWRSVIINSILLFTIYTSTKSKSLLFECMQTFLTYMHTKVCVYFTHRQWPSDTGENWQVKLRKWLSSLFADPGN